MIGWITTDAGSLDTGLLAMPVLICVGGVTVLFALPKAALRVGTGHGDSSR